MTTTPEFEHDVTHAQTRVDQAHPAPSSEESVTPSSELLTAIAGFDPETAEQQINGQALELAAMLREKQHLLERREAELNARTALLERDLRVARLKQSDAPLPDAESVGSVGHGIDVGDLEAADIEVSDHSEAGHDVSLLDAAHGADEFAGRQFVGREFMGKSTRWKEDSTAELDPLQELEPATDSEEELETEQPAFVPLTENDPDAISRHAQQPIDEMPDFTPFEFETSAATAAPLSDAFGLNQANPTADNSLTDADRVALDHQYDLLEAQRKELRQRETRVGRQQLQNEQMHDEVTELHREALEMRLATEQIWMDIMEEFPSEDRVRKLEAVREKLGDHYRMANDTLARRKDELHLLRIELNEQEQRLRQQRRDVQLWADRRYDEIESRVAKLTVRERELDQHESEFHRQSLQWQTQRKQYRQEIESLSWKLHEASRPEQATSRS